MERDELQKLEEHCIQENPPACAAACPIHLDARALAAEIARGDFAAAAKIIRKTVPFPGIVSRICEHPCQAVCKRGEAGEPISVRELERACLDWAADSGAKITSLPRREKRIAVVGGGLSGLTAAFDLARKGYSAVVFEKNNRLGGSLWNLSAEEILPGVIEADLQVLEKVGVEIRLGVRVGKDLSLTAVREQFDAVYLATGCAPGDAFGLAADERKLVAVAPITFATSEEGVFAGGGMLQDPLKLSHIQSISDGRRAAISIDRYLQRVSLSASRAGEGSFLTRLYTSTEGVEHLPAVTPAGGHGGYSPEEAGREAARCIQCQCLECVKVCEYLDSFGSYPKKYIRQIYNNLAIVMGQRNANKLINSCSVCGLCREVCPEDLHMGLVCKKARETLVEQGKMPPSVHEFPLRDMLFSNSEKCALARHQPGATTSRLLFFPGCQLSASAPEHVMRVYDVLREKLSGGVGLMLRCCGAPADWSGRAELFSETFQDFVTRWQEMGSPQLILACSTCYEIFKTHLTQASIVSLWEVFDRLGLPETAAGAVPEVVAVHDACTTRHEKQIQESVRNILRRLGARIEELPLSRERTECCGYGGLMFFANPELASSVIARRIAQSPADYVAYCAMCRDYLAHRGKRTLHLLDLIFGMAVDEAAQRKGPGYSQRHENRARLKKEILRRVWGQTAAGEAEMIGLTISDELRDILEQRQILDEDIRQVIEYGEQSGNKLVNRQTGHFLTHYKPAAVTYWVEYEPAADAEFIIHNAYSHRMEIVEDPQS